MNKALADSALGDPVEPSRDVAPDTVGFARSISEGREAARNVDTDPPREYPDPTLAGLVDGTGEKLPIFAGTATLGTVDVVDCEGAADDSGADPVVCQPPDQTDAHAPLQSEVGSAEGALSGSAEEATGKEARAGLTGVVGCDVGEAAVETAEADAAVVAEETVGDGHRTGLTGRQRRGKVSAILAQRTVEHSGHQ